MIMTHSMYTVGRNQERKTAKHWQTLTIETHLKQTTVSETLVSR